MPGFYDLLSKSEAAFILIFVVALFLCNEIGQRIGIRQRRLNEDRPDEHAGLVVGSILGLLAFVLALTLSNASTRFSQRQDAILAEANAISTAWLQAGAVGGTQAEALQSGISSYIAERHTFVTAPGRSPEITQSGLRSNALQNDIWSDIGPLVSQGGAPATASLMNAVNTMFDAATTTNFVMSNQMPAQIIILMLSMACVSMVGIGYQFAQAGRQSRIPPLVLSVVWAVIVALIIDVGMARIWSMQNDARALTWTMQSMGDAPPAQ